MTTTTQRPDPNIIREKVRTMQDRLRQLEALPQSDAVSREISVLKYKISWEKIFLNSNY